MAASYSGPMPTPLRAVLLAAWGTAYLNDLESLATAVERIERADEPHLVVPDPHHGPDELAEALDELRGRGLVGLRAALPVPGDLLGLLGPPALNQAALAAGEAVVAVPAPGLPVVSLPAFVPDVTRFGSPGDHGYCVTWRQMPSAPGTPDVPTVSQADRELQAVMRESTEALSATSAGSWSGDGRESAGRLRFAGRDVGLPAAAGPRAAALAQRAHRVLAIVEAARADDGGTVTAFAAQSRHAALAPLERAARRGLVAASGACLEMSAFRAAR